METIFLRTVSEKKLNRMVVYAGVEGFDEALARGKGLILCSAHYGNWEIMNLALGFRGLPMSAMARPLDNPLVHKFLEDIRVRPGNRVIYKHKSVRKIFSNLKENRVVGIVNDQDVHDLNRIMVPFFGRNAATTPVPAAVSIKTGAPIITGYAQPLKDGNYLLTFGQLIWPDQTADKDQETARITLLLNQRLEEQLNRAPEYWMWMHQRFKTGADGVTDFYRGAGKNRPGKTGPDCLIGGGQLSNKQVICQNCISPISSPEPAFIQITAFSEDLLAGQHGSPDADLA